MAESCLFVRDLRLSARLGVYDRERGVKQPIRLDLTIGTELIERGARSGRLADTVDYVTVTKAARDVVGRRHYNLVESLARQIAEGILERCGGTRWVRVRLSKLRCLPDAEAAGVELTLQRETRLAAGVEAVGAEALRSPEEVVIVGGGVAGLSAALWIRRLGHDLLLLDPGPELGGQLHQVHRPMPDLPGLEPTAGLPLARRLAEQFADHGGRWLAEGLTGIEPTADGGWRLHLGSGNAIETRALLLATGLHRRQLGVPGERALRDRGLLRTGSLALEGLCGKPAAVIGGGDAGCENALLLVDAGARVFLIHRGAELSARAQFRRAVQACDAIELILDAEVTGFVGGDRLEAVMVRTASGERRLAVDAALVRIGWEPNTAALPPTWRDERGYLRADPATGAVPGAAGVFAAGDVINPICPAVATAMGSGANAARAACNWLEAEGAEAEGAGTGSGVSSN